MIFGGRMSLGKAKCGIPAWKYNSESNSPKHRPCSLRYVFRVYFMASSRFLLGTFGNWFLPPGPTRATADTYINAEILLHTSAEIPANKLPLQTLCCLLCWRWCLSHSTGWDLCSFLQHCGCMGRTLILVPLIISSIHPAEASRPCWGCPTQLCTAAVLQGGGWVGIIHPSHSEHHQDF